MVTVRLLLKDLRLKTFSSMKMGLAWQFEEVQESTFFQQWALQGPLDADV